MCVFVCLGSANVYGEKMPGPGVPLRTHLLKGYLLQIRCISSISLSAPHLQLSGVCVCSARPGNETILQPLLLSVCVKMLSFCVLLRMLVPIRMGVFYWNLFYGISAFFLEFLLLSFLLLCCCNFLQRSGIEKCVCVCVCVWPNGGAAGLHLTDRNSFDEL